MAWPAVYGLNSASFDPRSRQRTTQPTIVLVHDAFHSPIHLERLARELQDNGHRVLVPHLPSSLTTYQPNILEADVQALCEVGRPELDSGRDIVLVLHGYAGIPGSTAAERLNQYALRRPRAGFVAHIVFIAAVVANAGECFLDVLRPQWLLQEVSCIPSIARSSHPNIPRMAILELAARTLFSSKTVHLKIPEQQCLL